MQTVRADEIVQRAVILTWRCCDCEHSKWATNSRGVSAPYVGGSVQVEMDERMRLQQLSLTPTVMSLSPTI